MQALRLGTDVNSFVRKEIKERMERTPDMPILKEQGDQLVFVYGTLKQGFGNHSMIDRNADYLGKARTLDDGWLMYDTGGFPVISRAKESRGDYLYGEIYSVDPTNMMALDGLEGNGYMYLREKIKFKLMDQSMESVNNMRVNAIREAWIYVGVDDYWEGYKGLTRIHSACPMKVNTNGYLATGLFYKGF